MTKQRTFSLWDCTGPDARPATLKNKRIPSPGAPLPIESQEFVRCAFDGCSLDGLSFSECVFRGCTFRDVNMSSSAFWSSQFVECVFANGCWIHPGFREVRFQDCSFSGTDVEAGHFGGCSFSNVTWGRGSIVCTYFDSCTLDLTSFTESVVNAVFRDCRLCEGAFDHIVNGDSSVTICSTGIEDGESPRRSVTDGEPEQFRTISKGKGQDPLEDREVSGKRPRLIQLEELDRLLRTESAEVHFQSFLEENPELLSVGVELGHHGIYVLSQVPFGRKHRADFMVGAKNSMGHFWTGLEIESPRHRVLKANGHFTQKVQHAIDQVLEWRNYVRTHRIAVQRPRAQHGEGRHRSPAPTGRL